MLTERRGTSTGMERVSAATQDKVKNSKWRYMPRHAMEMEVDAPAKQRLSSDAFECCLWAAPSAFTPTARYE